MPRKIDPSELSAASRQILARIVDPPVDLNDLWVVPATECEDLLREAYGNYGLETLPVPAVALAIDLHLSEETQIAVLILVSMHESLEVSLPLEIDLQTTVSHD